MTATPSFEPHSSAHSHNGHSAATTTRATSVIEVLFGVGKAAVGAAVVVGIGFLAGYGAGEGFSVALKRNETGPNKQP